MPEQLHKQKEGSCQVSQAQQLPATNSQPRFFAITTENLRDPNYDMRPHMLWLMEYASPALKAHVATLLSVQDHASTNSIPTQEPKSA